ncbi:MAG: hypothetical protein Q9169_003875 [Polycauliona sp. 2 TL-2023]
MVATNGRPSTKLALICPAFPGKKDQSLIVSKLREENKNIKDKYKALHNEIRQLQQQVSHTSELEQELKKLREIVESKKNESSISPSGPKTSEQQHQRLSQAPNDLSPEQKHAKSAEIENYRQRFFQCSAELGRVKEARALLESRCRAWKEKYQCLALQQSRGTAFSNDGDEFYSPGSAPLTQSGRAPDVLASTDPDRTWKVRDGAAIPPECGKRLMASPDAHTDQDDAETSDESEHHLAVVNNSNTNDLTNHANVNGNRPQVRRSQSEEPVFISEVAVNVPAKRKREKSPANTFQRPRLVKEEILSSSPIAPSARPNPAAMQESIDLDEISGNIYTPRKDRMKRQQVYITRSLSPSIQRMLDARPPINVEIGNSSVQEDTGRSNSVFFEDENDKTDGMAEVRDDAYYKRLGEEHAARERDADRWNESEKRRAKQKLHNERQLTKYKSTKETASGVTQRRHTVMQKDSGQTRVLQPSDADVVLPRTGDFPSNKKRRIRPPGGPDYRYVQELAEDGESLTGREHELLDGDQPDQAVSSKKPLEGPDLDPDAEKPQLRLNQLLTRPSPEKPLLHAKDKKAQAAPTSSTFDPRPLSSKRVVETANPRTPNSRGEDLSNARDPAKSVSVAARALKPVDTPNYRSPFALPSSKKSTKSHEPSLRSRPLSQLALDDFKINPNQNKGYDYAFKEVVRKQDQRKCLPGCTRLDCCGTMFRKMAETLPSHFYHTSRLNGPSQEYDEQGMMEDYLGDQAHLLKTMSREKKTETLLRAKTKIMADHYGRHREVYAREPSPVGYWDVDMPNSQEAAEMGRMAAIRTRQKVEQRYEEAVKKDGIWKFRDE